MQISMEFARRFLQAYGMQCQSLCQELRIPQTAFDILLFLANNPDCDTARDIVEIRGIKANLVSINVEKLVRDGYLERRPVPGDRRKVRLVCTEKARPIIEEGRRLQAAFFEDIFRGVDEKSLQVFRGVMEMIRGNLERKMEGDA